MQTYNSFLRLSIGEESFDYPEHKLQDLQNKALEYFSGHDLTEKEEETLEWDIEEGFSEVIAGLSVSVESVDPVAEIEKNGLWIVHKYKAAGTYFSALINGDDSGLEDNEAVELNNFEQGILRQTPEGFTFSHYDTESTEDDGSFEECDISGLFANCYTLVALYRKVE